MAGTKGCKNTEVEKCGSKTKCNTYFWWEPQ